MKELLQIKGVVVAGEFGPDGKVLRMESNMDMPEELSKMTGQYVASVNSLFNTLAETYRSASGMRWTPQRGWVYSGGDWTVIVGDGKGVFARTQDAGVLGLIRILLQVH